MKSSSLKLVLLLLGIAMISAQKCYINNCGCPGDFKEEWCNDSQSQLESEWCNESENQCGQCDGSWCPEEPRTNGVCYIDVCGCPDNWLNSWCDIEEAQFESEWCQENNFRCDQCGGYWCEGQQLVEGEYQNDNDNDEDNDVDSDADEDQEENIAEGEDQGQEDEDQEDVDAESGVCYIDVCGCPSDFLNNWCEYQSAQFGAEWCQRNAQNCEECLGYWCEGDDLIEDDKEEEFLCYISECGCPGNFQQQWCDSNYNFLPAGYCQDNEGNCQDCSGVWCPVGDKGDDEIDEDGDDSQTVDAQINIFYAGFALVLVILSI